MCLCYSVSGKRKPLSSLVSSQTIVILQTITPPVWATKIQYSFSERKSPQIVDWREFFLLFLFSVRVWCQQGCRTINILLHMPFQIQLKVFLKFSTIQHNNLSQMISYIVQVDHCCKEQKSTEVNSMVQRGQNECVFITHSYQGVHHCCRSWFCSSCWSCSSCCLKFRILVLAGELGDAIQFNSLHSCCLCGFYACASIKQASTDTVISVAMVTGCMGAAVASWNRRLILRHLCRPLHFLSCTITCVCISFSQQIYMSCSHSYSTSRY